MSTTVYSRSAGVCDGWVKLSLTEKRLEFLNRFLREAAEGNQLESFFHLNCFASTYFEGALLRVWNAQVQHVLALNADLLFRAS